MENFKILWVDDEVELLKPHILFLEEKGFRVDISSNGSDAIQMIKKDLFHIIFLDENMPGLSGLETLEKIKEISNVPVVMITKSEEEHLMEDAIGSQISDYLIKPVNPNQILLCVKKILDNSRLIHNKFQKDYRGGYTEISNLINSASTYEEWASLYQKLVKLELQLDLLNDEAIEEVFLMQKREANLRFYKFIKDNYSSWFLKEKSQRPQLSHEIIKENVFPLIKNKPVFFILIDNLRLDQWFIIKPLIEEFFTLKTEKTYCSILPTATQYSRNAIFSGLMPSDIYKKNPDLWVDDIDDGGKNLYESELLEKLLDFFRIDCKTSFNKILNLNAGKKLVNHVNDLLNNNLNIIVYNFVDILSHAKTEIKMIKELANNEKSYRDLTYTWFKNSPLFSFLKELSTKNAEVIITTDHGTINVNQPIQIIGEKNISTNLRYKKGRRINFNSKDVFYIKNPNDIMLPSTNLSSMYIFAGNENFFAYRNNYNHYVSYYKNTYQHGGISMEEMIIPFVHFSTKN